jgi:hypothetical protein
MHIGWPQGILLAMTLLGFGIVAAKHGEPRSNYSFPTTFVAVGIELGLLYWGGFFS